MSSMSQAGTSPPGSALNVQPNGTLVSMPITTAILPALMTWRACHGLGDDPVEARPGPPNCASM